jgi:Tn3 transposase DDE domain-containing protein
MSVSFQGGWRGSISILSYCVLHRMKQDHHLLLSHAGLLTNCNILDNTLEISAALNALAGEGYRPSIDELAALSPYQTRHMKRFGNHEIDFSAVPARSRG